MNDRDKDFNELLARLDRTYLSPRALARPRKFFVSVSAACDIRCPYCPRQYYQGEVKRGLMKIENFRRLAPALRYSVFTGLFGLGEPFLNPSFFEFLELAKQNGAYTATSTHGMSLTDEAVDRVIELGLDEIEISFDAPNRRLFEFLREGARFDDVRANVRKLVLRRQALGAERPSVNLGAVISRHNVKTMPDIVRLAKDMGVDKVVFTDMIVIDPNNKDLSVAGTPRMERGLDKARELGARLGVEIEYFRQNPFPWLAEPVDGERPPLSDLRARRDTPILDCRPPIIEARDEFFGCPDAWGTLVVDKDGDARPCCYIGDVMGNVFDAEASEVENGEGKLAIRRALVAGQLPAPCRDCAFLVRNTSEVVARALDEAEAAARQTDLSADQRREFDERLAEYRALFAKREGFK